MGSFSFPDFSRCPLIFLWCTSADIRTPPETQAESTKIAWTVLACCWKGVRLPRASGESSSFPELPRTSPEVCLDFTGTTSSISKPRFAKPMFCNSVLFTKTTGITKTTKTTQTAPSKGVDCWIGGDHRKHGNDEPWESRVQNIGSPKRRIRKTRLLSLWILRAIQRLPGSFPDFPEVPWTFQEVPWTSADVSPPSLGSLTPSGDSPKSLWNSQSQSLRLKSHCAK